MRTSYAATRCSGVPVCLQRYPVWKWAVLCFVAVFLQLQSASFAQKITLKRENAGLEEVFKEIRRQSGYNIFYSTQILKQEGLVSVDIRNAGIEEAMRKCLSGKSLDFKIAEKNVIISSKKKVVPGSTATTITITGKVTTRNDDPVEGVSVQEKKNQNGTVTDANGNYKLTIEEREAILVFNCLGFAPLEKKVSGSIVLNIVLDEKSKDLTAVVVTALNIKREEKSLGYAISTVKGEELTNAVSNNWTDALSGKVAGLNLLRSNGGPAGSNRIILRGENSLSGTTEALIVVDGVIVSSSSGRATGNGISYMGDDPPSDYGTSLNDINPEDIESVSVLKGPGATALYGARGAGGAIIITTKTANPRLKGIGVNISSGLALESASRWPDYQYEYGQGDVGQEYYSWGNTEDGGSMSGTSNAFGPKFDGQQFYQIDPVTLSTGKARTPWVAYPNNRKDFFNTGRTYNNNISLEGGTKETSIRLSYDHLDNTWIIPNTGYNRNTVNLTLNQKVNSRMQISSKVIYTNRASDNLPGVGYNSQTMMYGLIRMEPNANLDWYKKYWLSGQEQVAQFRPFSQAGDNPYLIAYEMLNKVNRHTVTAYVQTNYNFTNDLSLSVKGSVDMSYDSRSQQRPKNTRKYLDGMYRTQNIFNQELNADFLLRYKKDLTKRINSTFSLGGSILKNRYQKDEVRAERLFSPGVYNFANSMDVPLSFPFKSQFGVSSLYAMANFSYANYLYLDITGRQDWSSTLFAASGKAQGFFYPAVNTSFIVSDKFKLPAYVSLLKVRASYAQVGSGGTTPYLTSYVYNAETNFPSGLSNPVSVANPGLKAERTQSGELGVDIRLFNSRLGADIGVYQNNTKDQILRVPVDRASGFNTAILNSGEVRNRGIEITMNGVPVKSAAGKFTWTMTGTFAANRNKVLSLADGIETLLLQNGPGSRGSIEARVGGSMGDLYGLGYERAPDGQIVYANGYPVKSQTARWLANIYPKWKASFGNEFRYKQFRFNFLFDAQFGGQAYSHTFANNAVAGQLKVTLPGRYNGIVGKGVIKNPDGTYRPNDVPAEEIWTYYAEHYIPDNVEASIFSTNFIKFREARIEYVFPARLLKKLSIQKASVGIYGRDLFIFSKWPSFDPEFGTINNGLIQSGFEIGQFPATRTTGVNLNVSF